MKKRKRRNKYSALLTALIVLTITAIAVVGFILAWEEFDISGKLTALLDTDLFPDGPVIRSDTKVNITFSQPGVLPDAEREVLENYFNCYFASLGSFYHENISRWFGTHCSDRLFDDLALDHEIYAAKGSPVDYSYKECSVRISITGRRSIAKEKPNTVRITLQCASETVYGFSETASRASEEQHTFLITTKGKTALITGHTTDRQARLAAESVINEVLAQAGYTQRDISYTYYSPYISRAAEVLTERRKAMREHLSEKEEDRGGGLTAEYDYDRETAAAYARGVSHSPDFGEYDENDANFCSQCLYASGIPMDAQGDRFTQWKWYGYEENNAREKTGCTKSWFDRERFWTYARENSGFGLAALAALTGETGDIVQIIEGDAPVLQAVITGVITDKDGNAADYAVCTDKLKNVPLSLIRAEDFRIIHIVGYNTANI